MMPKLNGVLPENAVQHTVKSLQGIFPWLERPICLSCPTLHYFLTRQQYNTELLTPIPDKQYPELQHYVITADTIRTTEWRWSWSSPCATVCQSPPVSVSGSSVEMAGPGPSFQSSDPAVGSWFCLTCKGV